MSNRSLINAYKACNDEFYTRLEDIEKELAHYKDQFKGKVIFCGCDYHKKSNFYKFVKQNSKALGIKRVVCSGVENAETMKGSYVEFDGKNETIIEDCDGTFQTNIPKVVEKYGAENVVFVTNPPFSLFRELIDILVKYNVKFLLIANKNAITYKETFKLIREAKLFIGMTPMGKDLLFEVPNSTEFAKNKKEGSGYRRIDGKVYGRAQACWFTNLKVDVASKCSMARLMYDFSKPDTLESYYELSEDERNEKYPKYDNYDAINIDKSKDIPGDYFGEIGVPISFLYYLDPTVWDVVKFRKGNDGKDLCVNGKCPYFRIIIKRKPIK